MRAPLARAHRMPFASQGSASRSEDIVRGAPFGYLPNLFVTEGRKASLYTIPSRVTSSESLTNLFDGDGSAFIIHELEDRYLPDPPSKDAPGGARIACGVIVKE